jgi:hypothetical protein
MARGFVVVAGGMRCTIGVPVCSLAHHRSTVNFELDQEIHEPLMQ